MAYKSFTNGFPLPASDINNFLMDQSVITFASASERDSTLTSPKEGMLTYLQDTNTYTYYDSSAWQNLIGAGDPIDQSLLTATGDMIYASAAETAERLGIGSDGDVLTVASGVPTWAAPAGGGVGTDWQQISSSVITSGVSSINITGLTGYAKYLVRMQVTGTAAAIYSIAINGSSFSTWKLKTVGNGSTANMVNSSSVARTSSSGSIASMLLYIEYSSTEPLALYRIHSGSESTTSTDENYVGEWVTNKPTTSLAINLSTGNTGPGNSLIIYGGN